MAGGFRLGRIWGIQIRIDWSWFFILLLILWNLRGVWSRVHPEWNYLGQWGMAMVATLLFFASVLAHELAHSLIARAQGIPVRNITLFLFGGVSSLQHDPVSPAREMLMAAAGPLVSLLLGIVLLVPALRQLALVEGGAMPGDPIAVLRILGPVNNLLLWLGSVNLALGVFNLIPGFPLDGGRVLRAAFWAATRNLRRATFWATRVGRLIAWLMIGTGLSMVLGAEIPLLGTGLINGLWLALIGLFLNSASDQSYQRFAIQDVLDDVPVSRLMRSRLPFVAADLSLARLMEDYIIGTDDQIFPVLSEGQLVGLLTLDSLRAIPRERWETTLVRTLMIPVRDLVIVAPDENSGAAYEQLVQQDIPCLLVMQGDQFIGLLRRRDILRWLQWESDIDV